MLWQIGAYWQFDPDFDTEVEVTFTEESPGHTRVDVRHRHLERYGKDSDHLRCFDSPNGWTGILSRYLTVAGNPSGATTQEVETRRGPTTIGGFLGNLTVDNTVHAWDLGTTAGLEVRLDADLVTYARQWTTQKETLVRESGMFGEPVTPPAPADAQINLLAALGRRAW